MEVDEHGTFESLDCLALWWDGCVVVRVRRCGCMASSSLELGHSTGQSALSGSIVLTVVFLLQAGLVEPKPTTYHQA